eukprot:Clim_evm13s199 gene=Clim_evmTU13s199
MVACMKIALAVVMSATFTMGQFPFDESTGGFDGDFKMDNRVLIIKGSNIGGERYLHDPTSESYIFQLQWYGIPFESYTKGDGYNYLQKPEPTETHHITFGNDDGDENPIRTWYKDTSFTLDTGLENEEGHGRYSGIIILLDAELSNEDFSTIFAYCEKYSARIVAWNYGLPNLLEGITRADETTDPLTDAEAGNMQFTDKGKLFTDSFDHEYTFNLAEIEVVYNEVVYIEENPGKTEALVQDPESGKTILSYHLVRPGVELMGVWYTLNYFQQDSWPLFFPIIEFISRRHWTGARRIHLNNVMTNWYMFPEVRSPLCEKLSSFCNDEGDGRFELAVWEYPDHWNFPAPNYDCSRPQAFCDSSAEGVDITFNDTVAMFACEPLTTYEFNGSYDLIGMEFTSTQGCENFLYTTTALANNLKLKFDDGTEVSKWTEYGVDNNYVIPMTTGQNHINFDDTLYNYRTDSITVEGEDPENGGGGDGSDDGGSGDDGSGGNGGDSGGSEGDDGTSSSSSGGLSIGAIVGIAVAGVVVVALVVACFLCRRRRSNGKDARNTRRHSGKRNSNSRSGSDYFCREVDV